MTLIAPAAPHLTSVEGHARALAEAVLPTLSPAEMAALRAYAAFDSTEMNRYHHNPKFRAALEAGDRFAYPFRWEKSEAIQHDPAVRVRYLDALIGRLVAMDEALDRARLPTATVLYRGIKERIEDLAEGSHAVGAEIEAVGYWSTSTNPAIGLQFAHVNPAYTAVMYVITTDRGLPLGDLARYQVEDEVLLPRAQRYRVVGTEMVRAQRYDTNCDWRNPAVMAALKADKQVPLSVIARPELGNVLLAHLLPVTSLAAD